jgi:hypothetical protein
MSGLVCSDWLWAGLLWTKQNYLFDVNHGWMGTHPSPAATVPSAFLSANAQWRHLVSMRVLSVPDKWEFPWFAAWDLAFHASPLGAGRSRVRQGAVVVSPL